MAVRRTRSVSQRVSIWLTALVTLGTGLGAYRLTEHHPPSSEPLTFRFEELSPERSGIRFTHEKGNFATIFDNVRPMVQAGTAPVAVNDVDRDGLLDVYLLTSGAGKKNKLYHNLGGARFAEVDLPVIENVNDAGFSTDALFADVNNDGFDDLLIVQMSHRPRLFVNVPAPGTPLGRGFVDVTEASGLPGHMNAYTATFLDVDNDGDLDVVLAGYYRTRYSPDDVAGAPLVDVTHVPDSQGNARISPNNWGNATNGGDKHLLLNDGSGRFVEQDLAHWGFLPEHRFAWDIATGDLNRDGFTDLYFANDFGPDELYFNQAGHAFRPSVGRYPTDVGRDPFKGMNAEIGDVNGDGYPEIYVTNIFHPFMPEGNLLWLNMPVKGQGPTVREFHNVSAGVGVKDGGWGWGAKFVDVDLDGDVDIVATNGMISDNPNKEYWYRMTRLMGASGTILTDTRNFPAMNDTSLSGFEYTHVFVHEGDRFYERGRDAGIERTFDGRGVTLADLDSDGRIDVLITVPGKAPFIARNIFVPAPAMPEPPSFIGLQLEGDGRRVNRNAVGSGVTIRPVKSGNAPFPALYREISAGNGFSAQSMYWVVAGLGRYRDDVEVQIRWTDGTVATHRLKPDCYYHVAYGATPELIGGGKSPTTDMGPGKAR